MCNLRNTLFFFLDENSKLNGGKEGPKFVGIYWLDWKGWGSSGWQWTCMTCKFVMQLYVLLFWDLWKINMNI